MASPLNDNQGKWHKAASPFRVPIAPSLSPTALQWEPASNHLLSVLVVVFGTQGVFLVASGASTAEISYCRMMDADRDVDLFIKIVPKRFASGLQRSGGISNYVHDCGLWTPACRPGFPKVCIDGRMIFAYPFVDGSYLNNSMGDLSMLGSALARLHTALVSFPEAHKIAHSQRGMRTRMRRKARALLVDKCWVTGELFPVRTHLLQWLEIDALFDKDECQVIHNDLNAGNVLQDTKGNVWFLDFEEASWSYLPPYFDIAKVIERFILVNEDWDIQTKIIASRRLLDAYSVDRCDIHGMGGNIPVALGWLLGFSWLRMSNLLFDREAIQHPEVRKFLRLAELLDENESWLAAL
jgi:hypothetical protein